MNDFPSLPNYHIGRLVAEGGTAKVYWGIDFRSGFPVAIKELKVRHFKNAAIRENFKKVEAQLYLYMQHPNIPRLVDFIDMKEREQLYIVMEFVEGMSLEDKIYTDCGLLPEERALPIFLEVLSTIGYLHQHGILHLDIKLNNVMLQPDGHVKVIDLGIASRIKDASNSTGFGTPSYMPPEQSERGVCGPYTDTFALGVMLFEMLTGSLPFSSRATDYRQATAEIRMKIKSAPVPQMRLFYPLITNEMQRIVEHALAKEPYNRYQTCEAFADDIKKYMRMRRLI